MSWALRFRNALESLPNSSAPLSAELFSPEYRALVPPSLAARDALSLGAVLAAGGDRTDLWEPHAELGDGRYRLQLYGDRERSLDEVMPFLENLGLKIFDQIPFRLEAGGRRLFIRSFAVSPAAAGAPDLMPRRAALLEALEALLRGWVENDELNGLLGATGLSWREIDVLRAYRNYYFQLGSRFGRLTLHRALLASPGVAELLFRYFETRFRPDGRWADAARREEEFLSPLRMELAAALDRVADANEDRILRDLFNLIDSTLRTDFYREKPPAEHFIALKLASLGVFNSPTPRPLFEIYVHAKWMEGIHLRGAAVARGGLRWSDRHDDFRSEVLDLMQTQMIKNALIVPLGAKGGFVVSEPASDPAERRHQVQRAYATLIRGLLNLTDNRQGSAVEPPSAVVTYDAPDPYLVVAADKGTAGYSDFANEIAAGYGFWLGDAFASGGSHGYHHKQLGITARGAWVSVRRHFRESGQDIATRPFTAVGIGSMDGDVFGNGMLLSPMLRLVGAFSSHHIFLDPDPDPAASFRERQRLFHAPHSSWDDYDRGLISPGGGVFARDAKHIPLSPEAQAALGVRRDSVDGEGLVRLILAAPVDLLWLGGIGTYVKSSAETHEEVADRANDSVRLDARQIRAKVVGEGANLGFTQKARIEYALAGGRINTDAVDNSGGVDLSDHEVNLKIALAELLRRGELAGEDERNRLLLDCTEDVVAAVLANNESQNLCLSLDLARSRRDAEPFLEVADRLANAGLLDRSLESFPSRKEVLARDNPGLTRPELAVLMAYSKLALKRALLVRPEALEADWALPLLWGYFPAPVRERFGDALRDHGLAPEIIATRICNAVIGQAGTSFLTLVDDLEPLQLGRAIDAYLRFDLVTGSAELRPRLRELEATLPSDRVQGLYLQLEGLLATCCRAALATGADFPPGAAAVRQGQAELAAWLDYQQGRLLEAGRADFERRWLELGQLGLGNEAARLLFFGDRLGEFPPLADFAARSGHSVAAVAEVCDAVAEHLGLRRVASLLAEVRPRDRWERRALAGLAGRLRSTPLALAAILLHRGDHRPAGLFTAPAAAASLARLLRLERELSETTAASLAPFAALGAALEDLRDAAGTPDSPAG
jgi:glutamate dehydrogenase